MGLFSSVLGASDSIETRLVNEYTAFFQATGMSAAEAKTTARDMVAQAKQEVAKCAWPNYEEIIRRASIHSETQSALNAIREDGVHEDDIRWWWNMHPLERVMIQKADELNRMSAYIELIRQGLYPEQAAQRVWRIHPKFGSPKQGQGDDRPIPIELKRRINQFVERHYKVPDLLKKKIEEATSFNALVRMEIRAGNL